MKARLLASNLGFPEGPVVLPDGRLVFCDGNTGELLLWDGGEVSIFAVTGGSPRGAVSGIQRVRPDRAVELLFSEVDGHTLYGPNDLAFGPDGRLWFTDSGSEEDYRFAVRSPGRLFAAGRNDGEQILELPDVYPNG